MGVENISCEGVRDNDYTFASKKLTSFRKNMEVMGVRDFHTVKMYETQARPELEDSDIVVFSILTKFSVPPVADFTLILALNSVFDSAMVCVSNSTLTGFDLMSICGSDSSVTMEIVPNSFT